MVFSGAIALLISAPFEAAKEQSEQKFGLRPLLAVANLDALRIGWFLKK